MGGKFFDKLTTITNKEQKNAKSKDVEKRTALFFGALYRLLKGIQNLFIKQVSPNDK